MSDTKYIRVQTGQPNNGNGQEYPKKGPNQNNQQRYEKRRPVEQAQAAQDTRPVAVKRKRRIFRYWWVLIVILALTGIAFLGKGYLDTKNELAKLSDTKSASQADGEELVKDISKFFVLPEETPTVATVNDVSKLQGQEFFKDAQTGDKVLIFPDAGRALLYRPSTGKVIEYSKVNLNTGDGTSAATP